MAEPKGFQFSQQGETHSYLSKEDELVEADVHFVDVFNLTFDAIGIDNTKCTDVSFAEIQLNNGGEYRIPMCGDHVVVRKLRGGDCIYEKHLVTSEKLLDGKDQGRSSTKYSTPPRDHQYMRTPPMEGDRGWFVHGGAFLQLLRGGILRLGASPLCQFTMGKWENFWRLISQNWEMFSCGVNAYSVNHNGKITTAISWFRRDTFGLTFQKNPISWAARSDYHAMVDINGMGFFAGEVEPGDPDKGFWIRKNRLKIEILPDGTVKINQGKLTETEHSRQEIILGPKGDFFTHKQWNEANECCYYEHIETRLKGLCNRVIKMKGASRIEVDGSYAVEASGKISLNGKKIEIGKKSGLLSGVPSITVFDGANKVSQTPIHSDKGISQ